MRRHLCPGQRIVPDGVLFWACSMAVQLARAQEAARRALLRGDPSARGGAAQRLLDTEGELARVLAERNTLQNRLNACGHLFRV